MDQGRLRITLGALLALALTSGCRDRPQAPTAATRPRADSAAPPVADPPQLTLSIARGHAIFAATRDSLPTHVGGNLRCSSCHLRDGTDSNALPLTTAYARFPQYRSRSGTVQRIEERVNDCLLRSLNGSALDWADPAMRDLVAYLAFLSRGSVVGPPAVATQPVPMPTDTAAGHRGYVIQCVRCHGLDGAGRTGYPALWGPLSFNIGAGMSRLGRATHFVQFNMPYDRPGSLSVEDARNVAAYMLAHARPDFAGKAHDWPNGDAPADVAYPDPAPAGRP